MAHYSFDDVARLIGATPREVRLLVEEGRLRALRRGGVRVIAHEELERVGYLQGDGANVVELPVPPPIHVVLERLEEKAAELAQVRRQLADVQTRHAVEVKALRREVRELRESARDAAGPPGRRRLHQGHLRRSLGPLFGVDPGDDRPGEG